MSLGGFLSQYGGSILLCRPFVKHTAVDTRDDFAIGRGDDNLQ